MAIIKSIDISAFKVTVMSTDSKLERGANEAKSEAINGAENSANVGEEKELLLEKRSKLKILNDYLENLINTSEDKNAIDRPFIEKEIKSNNRLLTCHA